MKIIVFVNRNNSGMTTFGHGNIKSATKIEFIKKKLSKNDRKVMKPQIIFYYFNIK